MVGEAKEKHRLLERCSKYLILSCAWLDTADSRLNELRALRAPKQQPTKVSGCAKLEEGFLRLVKLRDERLARNRQVEYIDGKKHVWAPGTVAGRSGASISATFPPTPNRYSALDEWDDEESAEITGRTVRFSGHPDHPTRQKARPLNAFKLPPSVLAQTTKGHQRYGRNPHPQKRNHRRRRKSSPWAGPTLTGGSRAVRRRGPRHSVSRRVQRRVGASKGGCCH